MREQIATILTLFLFSTSSWARNYNKPITPVDYQKIIGTGFSTDYFKTLDFSKYHSQNIHDVYNRGFRNLRLRSRADLEGLNMTVFLANLETVVDDCLSVGVTPVISWIHHEDEANATEEARERYLTWWDQVATKLKNKNYGLSFNLFTELGVDKCGDHCENSLREDTAKYNNWTASVVNIIRHSGGNNAKRIIILGSPKKTGKGLKDIDPSIYSTDDYMLAEWHMYASGANKKINSNGKKGQKYWSGDGSDGGKANVDKALSYAQDFTAKRVQSIVSLLNYPDVNLSL
ncbi:cellulase/esterase CelE-like [Convolutriloba macropyga]|uniref:cellulase/esterase CelE-like n=1 Tax=Convolutriloba macropyga TaxID=536237 RepID=UPI003F5225E4